MKSDGSIKAMRDAAAQALADLQGQIAPLLQEMGKRKKEIALLDELIALKTDVGQPPQDESDRPVAKPRRKHTDVVENAKAILLDVGRPLHISELHRVFLERGFLIPGQGTDANLISHLRRSPEIVRIKRGFYALADPSDEPRRPERQVRNRRRRRVRKNESQVLAESK